VVFASNDFNKRCSFTVNSTNFILLPLSSVNQRAEEKISTAW